MKPFFTKAILVDVSRYLFGNQVLPEATEITVDMMLDTLAAEGLSADDIESGDVVIFRTGWEANWTVSPGSVQSTLGYYKGFPGVPGGVPGVGLGLARWLTDRFVSGVGADNWGVDALPAVKPAARRLVAGPQPPAHEGRTAVREPDAHRAVRPSGESAGGQEAVRVRVRVLADPRQRRDGIGGGPPRGALSPTVAAPV